MSHDSRFTKLGIIGKGGFATVYRAEDKKLNREVALKELHENLAARADIRGRFMFEAEVAARLQCPSVPTVFDRADCDHGRPYYVMQLVNGQTLSQIRKQMWFDPKIAMTPRNKSFVGLLELFVKACQVVQHAHSRGVLHLDIKPSNIMQSADQVFVMDWGLATYTSYANTLAQSQLFEEEDWSRTGSSAPLAGPIGTPGFMSGEQAAGDQSRLSKQSDIYGLGATLYFLLTGQRAFEYSKQEDLADFVHRVECGDFPRPRKIQPNIPQSLEEICLKAMATNPRDRYQDCCELAEAVKDWIETPVRRKRLLRRLATTAAFFTATIVPPWLVRANQPAPKQHSEASFGQLTTAVETAIRSCEQTTPYPTKTQTETQSSGRDEILRLVQIVEEAVVPEKLALRQCRLLADWSYRIGDDHSAVHHYSSYAEKLEDAFASDPNTQLRLDQAFCHRRIGDLYLRNNSPDPGRAVVEYRRAVRLCSDLLRTLDNDSCRIVRLQLARSQSGLARALYKRGNVDHAKATALQSLKHVETLLEVSPHNYEYLRESGVCLNLLGIILLEQSPDEARQHIEGDYELGRRLAQEFPEKKNSKRDLAVSAERIGDLYLRLRDLDRALEHHQEALEIRTELMRSDVTNFQLTWETCLSHKKVGHVLLNRKEPENALRYFASAIEECDLLIQWNKDNVLVQTSLMDAHNALGDAYLQLKQIKKAGKAFHQAAKLGRSYFLGNPYNIELAYTHSVTLSRLGDVLLNMGEFDRAAAQYQQDLKVCQEMVRQAPNDGRALRHLAYAWKQLGNTHLQRHQYGPAAASYQRGLDVLHQAPATATLDDETCVLTQLAEHARHVQSSLKNLHSALTLHQRKRGPVLLARISALLAKKDIAAARRTAAAARTIDNRHAALLTAAQCYARCANVAGNPKALQDIEQAIELLHKAQQRGPIFPAVDQITEFKVLKGNVAFAKLRQASRQSESSLTGDLHSQDRHIVLGPVLRAPAFHRTQ